MGSTDNGQSVNRSGPSDSVPELGSGTTVRCPAPSAESTSESDVRGTRSGRRPGRVRGDDKPAPRGSDVVGSLYAGAKSKRVASPYDPDTAELAPSFWQWATQDRYEDGSDRLLPEIKWTRVSGGWQITLQDVETAQQTHFTTETAREWVLAAERHLTSGECCWMPYKCYRNPKGLGRHDKKNG
jgi:hypothetical protein